MELAISKLVSIAPDVPPIIAVQLPDKRIGATLHSLCEKLDLNRVGQMQRIRRSPKLGRALLVVRVATPGGPQQMDVLQAWAISVWLTGLQATRLPEEKQALALLLQEKAFETIERAFSQPEQAPPDPIPEAPQSALGQIRQAILLLNEGLALLEAEQQEVRSQFHTERQEWLNRQAVLEYDQQRLAQVYLLAGRLRSEQGRRIEGTLAALAASFGVEDVSDLPENVWPDVLVWFDHQLASVG